MAHIAGNVNTSKIRRFPVVSEVCVQYVRDVSVNGDALKVWLKKEWQRTGLPLRCANEVMKAIVDRFGEDVKTAILDEGHFSAEVEVSASPTFYSWLFTYGGRMRVLSPQMVKDEYIRHLQETLQAERQS